MAVMKTHGWYMINLARSFHRGPHHQETHADMFCGTGVDNSLQQEAGKTTLVKVDKTMHVDAESNIQR